MLKRHSLAITALCLVGYSSADAADLHVSLDGTMQYASIQAAIDASVDFDKVYVHYGEYTEHVNMSGKAIHLWGIKHPDSKERPKWISGITAKDPLIRINGSGDQSVLQDYSALIGGFDFIGHPIGYHTHSALYLFNCSPLVMDCTFTNFNSWRGGGAWCEYCQAMFMRCLFKKNHTDFGGALYLKYSPVKINSCAFIANWGDTGGAIYVNHVGGPTMAPTLYGNLFLLNDSKYNSYYIHHKIIRGNYFDIGYNIFAHFNDDSDNDGLADEIEEQMIDVTGDGEIDAHDIYAMITTMSGSLGVFDPGDLNMDGVVDGDDLEIWLITLMATL